MKGNDLKCLTVWDMNVEIALCAIISSKPHKSSGTVTILSFHFFFFFLIFIVLLFIYNVVLVSALQHSESVIHILCIHPLFFRFFSRIGHYRVLSRGPCPICRSLFIIYFIYSSVCSSMSTCQCISPLLPTW